MRAHSALLAGILGVAACSEPSGPQPGEPGLVILASGVTDTVDTVISDPIVVQVTRENGTPAAGDVVQFSGSGVWLSPTLDRWAFPWNGRATTDSRGRAVVYVRLGTRSGSARVSAQAGEYADTIEFQVIPGVSTQTHVTPHDTAVSVGAGYSLVVGSADRYGNPHGDILEGYVATSADPRVARIQGSAVSAEAIGRAAIQVSSAFGTTSAHLSVVPDALLAIVDDDGLVLMPTTGTIGNRLTSYAVSCPRWHPDAERILVDGLRFVTMQGEVIHLPTGRNDLVAGCGEFSADGTWIYFDGRLATEPEDASQIWRIRTDGTGVEQVIDPGSDAAARYPSPSPDGERIVYTRIALQKSARGGVLVHTLSTGAADTIHGSFLSNGRWSPDGEWIVSMWGSCNLVWFTAPREFECSSEALVTRPDGSAGWWLQSPGTTQLYSFLGNVSWSPDGKWLAGKAFYPDLRIHLVNVATGEALPLNGATRAVRKYSTPAWRPGPIN